MSELLRKVMTKFLPASGRRVAGLGAPRGASVSAHRAGLLGKHLHRHRRVEVAYAESLIASGELASTNDPSSCECYHTSSDSDDELEEDHGTTTVVVSGIPPGVTQEMLLQQWPLSWGYDFLHVRRDPRSGGRAVVNFVSSAHLEAFSALWHRGRFACFGEAAPMNVTPAEVQGVAANLRQAKAERRRGADMGVQPPFVLAGARHEN